MASRQVVDRRKSADGVIAAVAANVDLLQEALAEKARPFLKKGHPAPDFGAAISRAKAVAGG